MKLPFHGPTSRRPDLRLGCCSFVAYAMFMGTSGLPAATADEMQLNSPVLGSESIRIANRVIEEFKGDVNPVAPPPPSIPMIPDGQATKALLTPAIKSNASDPKPTAKATETPKPVEAEAMPEVDAKKAVTAKELVEPNAKPTAPAPKLVSPAQKSIAPSPKSIAPSPKSIAPSPKPIAPAPKPAAELVRVATKEVIDGLQRRNLARDLFQFQNYAGFQLNRTASPRRTGEVTGNCRLSWFDYMLRNPLKAPAESEAFTNGLFQSIQNEHVGLDRVLFIARDKMDVRTVPGESSAAAKRSVLDLKPVAALAVILENVRRAQAASIATLTETELASLRRDIYPRLVSQNDVGYTLANRSAGRRVCDLLEKMDRTAIHDAAETLAPIADPVFLDKLTQIPTRSVGRVRGVSGTIANLIETSSGTILVGGPGSNSYDLDSMPEVNVVVDLGGNDIYREGTVSVDRPVLITIDLDGHDQYIGSKPGVQGAGILGISMLVDRSGNDRYQARDVAQASSIGGVGILIDHEGDDRYQGFRRVQGHAFAGVGILLDRDGNDQYRGAMWTQGMGAPLGFGLLTDLKGKDHYYTGGHFLCSYIDDEDSPTPGYEGWGQGVGAGLRSISSGGIGVILEGDGDDVYEFDYLSHGGGYWMGLGFARDFGGNDQRVGATLKCFDGSPRKQKRFQRFGCGFGCHYAAGFCFDDAGNDTYNGNIMGLGHAWDCSIAMLGDFSGNDQYRSSAKTTQGNGSQAGLGILFDHEGDDRYVGYSQGHASSSISYHEMPYCGGNFSFLIDHGGTDSYGSRAKNNSLSRRGSNGGFLIDRGKPGEVLKTQTVSSSRSTQQQKRTVTSQRSRRTTSR